MHDPSAAQRGRHRSAAASLYGEFTVALGQEIARFLVGDDVMIEERNELTGLQPMPLLDDRQMLVWAKHRAGQMQRRAYRGIEKSLSRPTSGEAASQRVRTAHS